MKKAPSQINTEHFLIPQTIHHVTFTYRQAIMSLYACVYVCMHVCMYIYQSINGNVIYVCASVYICSQTCMNMCLCMYPGIFVFVYMHVHTHSILLFFHQPCMGVCIQNVIPGNISFKNYMCDHRCKRIMATK